MTRTHRELVTEATRGDRTAVDALFQRHLPGLLAYVRLHAGRVLLARESSVDLVQSACRELLDDMAGGVELDEPHFRHWLYNAAERKIVDRARHHARDKRDVHREIAPREQPLERELSLFAAGCQSFFTPSRDAQAREELEVLERSFRALPPEYREVITLARLIGLPHAEIAERLGKSEGAVRILLHRALARLAHASGREV